MKPLKALSSVLLIAALGGMTSEAETAITVPGLYNTGVNNGAVVLPQQSLEQHYSVSGAANIAYVVPPVYEPNLGWAWLPAPAGSAWIGPNSTTNTASPDPVGIYHYTIQFDLSGYNPADVRISGSWMTDNTGEMFLNGVSTGLTTDGESYKHLTAFNLDSGFVAGMNTLEFRVLNEFVGPNPSGLCVANLAASLVPEPSAFALTSAFFVAAVVCRSMRTRPGNNRLP